MKEKENQCLCTKCTTHSTNKLKDRVFCSIGASKVKVKTPRLKNACNCMPCPIHKEGNFGGALFCMGELPTEAGAGGIKVIDLSSASVEAKGTEIVMNKEV